MLTDQEVKKIQERCNKATPEPWEWSPAGGGCDPETGPWGEPPAFCVHSGKFYKNPVTGKRDDLVGYYAATNEDAEFIAHARKDLPDALAALAESQAELAQAKAERERSREALQGVCVMVEEYVTKEALKDCGCLLCQRNLDRITKAEQALQGQGGGEVGRPVSRPEALQIAGQILEDAERERLEADKEGGARDAG